jgi:hypothetical protein
MPKHDAMAQISRPFQIVVVVFLVFACVWLFALQGRSSTTTSSTSAPVVSATTPAASAPSTAASGASSATAATKPTGSSTHVYHGPVPGLEGLTRDISRAHHAVAVSGDAAPSSSSTAPAASTTTATSGASAGAPAVTHTHSSAATAPTTKATPRSSSKTSTSAAHKRSSAQLATPAGQRTVEAELAKGDVVLLLFWNPKGVEDMSVHRALQQVAQAERHAHPQVAVQEALAGQVASYGSVTRGVQVYATPTLFVINKKGQAIVLTGVQDSFSIEQSISEAAHS